MKQSPLFDSGDVIRCPLCPFEKHCGSKAELGPPEHHDTYISRTITCLSCGATGNQSTQTDRPR